MPALEAVDTAVSASSGQDHRFSSGLFGIPSVDVLAKRWWWVSFRTSRAMSNATRSLACTVAGLRPAVCDET